jgi:hypothetical protein
MTGASNAPSEVTSQATLRAHKVQVTAVVSRLAVEHRIRVLAAGGVVFASLGLVSPRVARAVIVIVEPIQLLHLVLALEGTGWRRTSSGSTSPCLPPVYTTLVHSDWACTIDIYDVFPAFYTAPATVFDVLWERRQQILISGHWAQAVDRTTTVLLAAHDRLGPLARNPRALPNTAHILDLYRHLLTEGERADLLELIALVDGWEPLRGFLDAAGITGPPMTLPSVDYTRARLYLDRVDDSTILALAMLEAPSTRWLGGFLVLAGSQPRRVFLAWLAWPRTVALLAGARRRRRTQQRSRGSED